MKKALRLLAATLAVTAAITGSAVSVCADDTASSSYGINLPRAGGWETNEGAVDISKNPAAKSAFKKAIKNLTGVKYQAIALLGSQVVAGMNYAILCRTTAVYPDAQPQIEVVYIYEDLQGNAEITGFQTIIGEQRMGGFSANSGKLSIKKNKTVYKAYKKAVKGLTGVSYTPVAYLGSQVVAGTNYLVLCRSKGVYPGAAYQWSLVKINKDLKGKASLADIDTLSLGSLNPVGAENEGEEMTTQIANPWTEYSSVSEAAAAAGVEFSAPDKLGSHKISYISAMKGLVDVRYTKGENVICVRKGLGTDDISGDYNTYKNVTEKKINGITVTLKSNGKGIKAAVWTDGNNSFSVYSDNALSEKFMKSIITEITR